MTCSLLLSSAIWERYSCGVRGWICSGQLLGFLSWLCFIGQRSIILKPSAIAFRNSPSCGARPVRISQKDRRIQEIWSVCFWKWFWKGVEEVTACCSCWFSFFRGFLYDSFAKVPGVHEHGAGDDGGWGGEVVGEFHIEALVVVICQWIGCVEGVFNRCAEFRFGSS